MGPMSRLLGRKKPQPHKGKQATVISFMNQKGGVGKTTMAFNTAHALKAEGQRVLVIDMDPQANLGLLFQEDEASEFNVFHLLINSLKELKALHTPVMFDDLLGQKDGVSFLPSGQDLSGFDLTVAGLTGPRQLILKNFLSKQGALERFDFILIDCPPTLGLLAVNSICASKGIIVPFRPDHFSKKGVENVFCMLEDIDEMGLIKAPEIVGLIPNLMEKRRKADNEQLKSIGEWLGDWPVFEPFSNRSALAKGQELKKSVYAYKSKDYLELQEQFTAMAQHILSWSKNGQEKL